jgi:hypothetical protein
MMLSRTDRVRNIARFWKVRPMPSARSRAWASLVIDLPFELDVAGLVAVQAAQAVEQRGLAGAVGADQAAHMAFLHVETHAVECHDAAEADRHTTHAEQGNRLRLSLAACANHPVSPMTSDAQHPPVRVWDLPTRAFHWLLALAVIGLVVTAKVGGNAMLWHMRLGLVVRTLLSFRIVWGLVGGRWSRFASFIYAPGKVLRYLRGDRGPVTISRWATARWARCRCLHCSRCCWCRWAPGLVSDDEIATVGPLNRYVSSATALPPPAGTRATASGSCWAWWRCTSWPSWSTSCAAGPGHAHDHRRQAAAAGRACRAATTLACRGLAAVVLAACAALAAWLMRAWGPERLRMAAPDDRLLAA